MGSVAALGNGGYGGDMAGGDLGGRRSSGELGLDAAVH